MSTTSPPDASAPLSQPPPSRLGDPRTWAVLPLFALLLASIRAYPLIPGWGRPWGLDLQNLHAFHGCEGRNDPYLATGAACHDLIGRPMAYPPLLYWAFAWTRLVSFNLACWIWAAFVVFVVLAVPALWAPPGRALRARALEIVFGGLLLSQFPTVFAIERGNNDAIVVLLWTMAAALYVREKQTLAGALAGLAAAAKLYPAFGCVVLLAGLAGTLVRGRAHLRGAFTCAATMALAPAAATLLLFAQTRHYVERILPTFAAHLPAETVYSHSIPVTFGERAKLVSAALVVAWCLAALRRMNEAPLDVFAGALAISTYVARTSFDYNLVTVYPLLVVLVGRALHDRTRRSAAYFATAALGIVAELGNRFWFEPYAKAHVELQVVWLLAAAALVAMTPRPATGAAPRATPAVSGMQPQAQSFDP